ncbi:MAG: RNA polymerase sporulation sigma factor SigK [Clostridia bacterium]|nr:RNA polymerase sporulation sigma factor SigK [Clostridia bacterium]MBR5633346.1 RNA polymerase sporulation sigma factor SigK [Clostridia bacterium]
MLELLISVLAGMSYVFLSANPGSQFPPPLSKDEEALLFESLAKTGDEAARNKLISHNLRLVAHIVKKYYQANPAKDDLISIGTIGLIKAIDSFKCTKGARFGTYGAKCIQNEILMYFRSQKKLASEVSMNETIETDRDGNPLTYMDIIKVDDTIADDIDLRIKLEKVSADIKSVLNKREREIIVLRYGLASEAPLTQREVAEKLGISRSYVSRIEKTSLEKLRACFD